MASMARGKSGAILSTCSLVAGRREYGGRGLWERWREAMLLFSQWVKGERWEFGGPGLVSPSLDRLYVQATPEDDVGGTFLPDRPRVRLGRLPMCCRMMGSPSI